MWRIRRMRRIRPGSAILELGANQNGFARFARCRVVVADRALEHLRAARATQDVLPVAADAAALPFRDGAFAVCVCMDTFEHFDEPTRARCVQELARVAGPSATMAIGFPAGDAAARAEAAIREAHFAFTGRRLVWLEEHALHPLPDPARVAAQLSDAAGPGRTVSVRKNASLWIWHGMWRILMCGWPGRGNALAQAALRLVTPVLCRIHTGVCYRAVVWLEPAGDPRRE
ncbi:MAG: class I SAM-dependent methyltransferase [Candidatus Hydrogenedentes bacterium]|nr:class I SAM-dependent methyltransferase [Candidatus Hydrogenedentota bacterium]